MESRMASACPVGVNPHVPGFPLWDRHRRQRVSVGSTSALPLRQGVPRLLPGVHPFALVSTLPFLAKRSRKTICNAGPRVAVIGAGPAGLASAVALRRECPDVDVMVYERSPELRPGVGGGVQLHSGAALLQDLGVDLNFAQAMRRIRSRADSFKPFVGSVRRPNGEPASCTVMRDALLRAIADQLPVESISLGMELKDIQAKQEPGRVTCHFADSTKQDFDLVIAADGIGSLARGVVLQEDEEPRYTGLRIQYGVREAGGRPTACEEEVHQWFGQGVYALTATYGGLDGKMFEMLAVVFRDDAPVAENPNWNPVEVKDNCLERLRAAGHRDEVLELAKSCSRFFELGVCERPLGLNRWHRDRVVLVGDSAHAMPPFLGQGANQGIQDAVCLASELRNSGFADFRSDETTELSSGSAARMDSAIESALSRYTAKRLPPVALLGLESNFLGQVETLPGAVGAFIRDNFFRATGRSGVAGLVFLNGAIARV
ncbi:unnamed protein product [Durusdinium trenchii]|uniref:FAD-binding domain-containing protein n=1 Tax=Durusdinium trenchii TaxID=1381693 RepID=A0ABP0NEH0_9DINO